MHENGTNEFLELFSPEKFHTDDVTLSFKTKFFFKGLFFTSDRVGVGVGVVIRSVELMI